MMQPLGDLFNANAQNKPSPAQLSLKANLQKHTPKTRFQVAEDDDEAASVRTPTVLSPVNRALFAKQLGHGKENRDSPLCTPSIDVEEEVTTITRIALKSPPPAAIWSPKPSTQDTAPESQDDTLAAQQASPCLISTTTSSVTLPLPASTT